jgi:hypothetical protein
MPANQADHVNGTTWWRLPLIIIVLLTLAAMFFLVPAVPTAMSERTEVHCIIICLNAKCRYLTVISDFFPRPM